MDLIGGFTPSDSGVLAFLLLLLPVYDGWMVGWIDGWMDGNRDIVSLGVGNLLVRRCVG